MDTRIALTPTVEDLRIYDRIFKRTLKCKCFALIFCITGTVILLLMPYDFLDSQILAIILPGFLTGYILINIAGILTACRGLVDLIADIFFSAFGIIANFSCGIYLLYYWIEWVISTFQSGNGIEGASYFVLSLTCLFNTAAMAGQLILSVLEIKRRTASNTETNEE